NAKSPTIHKTARITNNGRGDVRVMQMSLGRYRTRARVSDGEQGFPVYANDEAFFTLAHPAGWGMGRANGSIELRQYPGMGLSPGESLDSMEAIVGVTARGKARDTFRSHVRSRMRRTRRKSDRGIAIYEPFGSWVLPPGTLLA